MSRITPVTPEAATEESKELFEQVHQKLGRVPNLMQTLGHSAAALSGYLSLNDALSQGSLSAKDRERIALAVAEYNGCGYCLAAHSAIGKMVGLNPNQIIESRNGHASDSKADALLRFAHRVLESNGQINDSDLEQFRAEGYSDGEVAEVIAHISLSVLTNFFNNVAKTEIDFPKVDSLAA
ncbi:Carboxymuconolactone decarboxylase family protein [Thalassoglobus neptunius]|uniref:Carboxymuconolactone decarboxylase family protein n=1 Tax=Thalassoglobus neptunius TaxID=1938619 RepID=A0A5C5VYN5_9PLAN|nr:peroxidase-related enzyme [Thalassoglobus neptunius]TWT42622.1 Carboxymuconolactone decarboxylase family protein [Thalassoglobus neptunius]